MSVNPEGPIIINRTVTYTCTTGSLNPVGDAVIKWKRGNSINQGSVVFTSEQPTSEDGDNNGHIINGTYTYVADNKDHNGKYISCNPRWDSNDLNVFHSQQLIIYCKIYIYIYICDLF